MRTQEPSVAARPETAPLLSRVVPPAKPLGTIGLLRALARNPIEAWSEALYNETHRSTASLGRRFHIVTDPDLVQGVLVKEAAAFGRTPEMDRTLKPALGEALLTADGPHWRWQRRATAPAFRQDRLDTFLPAMSTAANDTATRWSALPDGTVIDVGHEMMRTTFDIIVATMLSGGKAIDTGRVETAINTALGATNWSMLYSRLKLPPNTWHPGRGAALAARQWLRELALEVVTDRRRRLADNEPRRGDLVDLLIEAEDPGGDGERVAGGMSDRDIADNILTFIAAGHETTALALTWAFYALSHHPDCTARIRAELHAVTGGGEIGPAELKQLSYTRQVIQEALRLYPSAPVIARYANRALQIGPLSIRPRDTVIMPIYVIHRHRRLWSDPDRFDPDRFSPEQSAGRHRYAWLPFGAGPRICIGLNFALNEAVIILATLLSRFDLTQADAGKPKPLMRVTLRPHVPMRMTLHRL